MRIIEPKVELVDDIDGAEVLRKIEKCGREAYKSQDKIVGNSAESFIANLIARGHESVLEHFSFTLLFTCDRGVTHELVRHRIASFTQESTRYCNYSQGKFGEEITVIKPCFWEEGTIPYTIWKDSCAFAEKQYFQLLKHYCSPQQARAVLPNSLKADIVMTANLREWRHFFKLRCDPAAHPQMRQVALQALNLAKATIPVVFDDLDFS